MAESKAFSNTAGTHSNFKEAVCIDAGRIYDSCSERGCACYNISRWNKLHVHLLAAPAG